MLVTLLCDGKKEKIYSCIYGAYMFDEICGSKKQKLPIQRPSLR